MKKYIFIFFAAAIIFFPKPSFALSVTPTSTPSGGDESGTIIGTGACSWSRTFFGLYSITGPDYNSNPSSSNLIYATGPVGNGTSTWGAYGFPNFLADGNYAVMAACSASFAIPNVATFEGYAPNIYTAGINIGYDLIPYLVGNVSECDIPASASLLSPAPSSTLYNNFPTWKVNTPGTLEGCNYNLTIFYTPNIGSLVPRQDNVAFTVTPDTTSTVIEFPKSVNIWNFYNATTTQINYTLMLQNAADNVVVAGGTGGFYLSYSATSSPATAPQGFNSTLPCGGVCNNFGQVGSGVASGSIATPSSTVAVRGAACTPPQNGVFSFFTGEDFAYGFCVTINWLFVPNDTTEGMLAGDMCALQTVPPFSWFFAVNADIGGAVGQGMPDGTCKYTIKPNTSVAPASSLGNSPNAITPDGSLAFTVQNGIGSATSSLVLIPANLASSTFLAMDNGRLVDDYYNFVLTFVILIAIIAVWKIAL